MLELAAMTCTIADAKFPFADALMVAEPSPTARTRPDASTVATDGEDDVQLNATPPTKRPLRSRALACNRTVSRTETIGRVTRIVSTAGEIETTIVAGRMTKVARPTLSAAAEISTTPSALGVTTPSESTVATCGFDVDHSNGIAGSTDPFLPIATAENVMRSESRMESGMKIVSTDGLTRTELIR